MPSKTWVRRRLPSMTWKWTRTRSPGSKDGSPFLTWARSMLSMTLLITVPWLNRREKTAGAVFGRRAVGEWYLLRVPFELRGAGPALLGPPAPNALVVARDQHLRH